VINMTWKDKIKKAPLKDFERRMARHKGGLRVTTPPASEITLDEALAEIKARREPNPKHIEVLEELIEIFDEYHEIDAEPKDSEGYPY